MKFLFLFLCLALPLSAKLLSEEEISAQIEAVAKLPKSDESDKVGALWDEVLNSAQLTAQILEGKKQFEERTKKLGELTTLTIPDLPAENAGLTEQMAFEESLNAAIASAKARKIELEGEPKVVAARNVALSESLAKKRAELADLEIPAAGADQLSRAENQLAEQKKAWLEATLTQIEAERGLNSKRTETLAGRIARRSEQITKLNEMLTGTAKTISLLRSKETKSTSDSLDQFDRKFSEIPSLKAIVDEIRVLNNRRIAEDGIESQLKEAESYLKKIQSDQQRIAEQSKNAKDRINLLERAHLNVDSETGLQLRTERTRLPSVSGLNDELRQNVELAVQSQIQESEFQNSLARSPISTGEIDVLLENHPDLTRGDVDALLSQRNDVLTSLIKDYQLLIDRLRQATAAANITMAKVSEYSSYLDERLLWIKSTRPLSMREPLEEWGRIVAFFSPELLKRGFTGINDGFFLHIVPCVLLTLLFIFVLLRRRKLNDLLDGSSKVAMRRNCTSMVPTFKTIGVSILLASGLPALVFVAYFLVVETGVYAKGFFNLGIFLLISGLLLKFSRKKGLFTSHFKIPVAKAELINRTVALIIPIGAPFAFLVGTLIESETSHSSGRVIFILAMMLVFWFFHRLLHPSRSILKGTTELTPVQRGTYFLGIGVPLVLAIGAGLGYFASVLTLRVQIMATLGLLLLAFLVIRFFNRWILVSRRRLAISQALRRREVALAERERARASEEAAPEKEPDLPTLDEVKAQAVNVVEVEVQTIQLVRLSVYFTVFFAIWGVWSSTLPALSILDKVRLWKDSEAVVDSGPQPSAVPGLSAIQGDAKEESPGGEKAADLTSEMSEEIEPEMSDPGEGWITLQDIFLSILIGLITFVAARNIPSLLSLTVFNRINLGPGGNFALTTTARYLIVLIGVVFALGHIGITWGKVQWLAAAITLGIGFGLQEIFANFVAGIIMLFERPIRLGDVVTVGEVSGKVTQINIRATTIQQFNNRELLVPNKEFITSQLVNWTLRDTVLRFELVVGIAYGSETRKAAGILKSILDEHPKVIAEPTPDVLFTAFGASTLDFTVRGFVGCVEDLISTQSEIHYLIDDAFREAGIEIAFPQQDIHIRSISEQIALPAKS